MLDRAYGCLAGAAIGDAMGMPASFFTRKKIKETYDYIQDFLEPEKSEQIYHGNLEAGDITDDTQESMIIANILIEHGKFQEEAFQLAMKNWAIEQKMLESTVIGPSTRRFLTALIEGADPKEGAKTGDTNGSAMRVAPIGIKYWYDLDLCIKAAAKSSLPSHGSAPAVAGACAVAAACAAGIKGGYSTGQIMEKAIHAAQYGEEIGFEITAPRVSKRIALAKRIVDENREKGMQRILDELVDLLGAGMKAYESIPLSFGAFYAAEGNAREGILAAVNAGDDADTNGSICGAICGAYSGRKSLPEEWIQRVERKSNLNFHEMASMLLEK
ncbi:ADP-ribosylglycohydrolase family protein [Sinanaerobacter chloroacetimidivorans]|jgi:ADP-ribosylglycohydrolase|uniref:ADP-ribosylglycohydrolase family protein n=1 Tax=Sinanaerobacter chloroacetimidivorans TaxID=2818044 RepID=A0A8J7VWV3_9FIRM|nr:ADP-ribosylglycohydrolase family protein [Sinanaerobacter chloroacetimidivorans]MBR0596502.1 ADP-ribosylglycohydrolase family protein [Sinanaerobacter chloroacetimidivorans]